MRVITCTEDDATRWTQFVTKHLMCSHSHSWQWQRIFKSVFGWSSFYLMAEEDGTVSGVLPLIWQKTMLSGYLSSMPHLTTGGIVADNDSSEQLLLESAIDMAKKCKASYLELRHTHDHGLCLFTRTDKVTAVLPVEPDADAMLHRLDKKTRNLVRKSLSHGMKADFGESELLEEFYNVYRQNMRDLGSPSYARAFFAEILRQFRGAAFICVVRRGGESIAAAFLIGFNNTLEVPWASSKREHLALKPNMFLYWQLLQCAADRGYKWFDFGRSSVGSGTYQFKMQWGAQEKMLHWNYWLPCGSSVSQRSGVSRKLVSRIWRYLPPPVTNCLGPHLIRYVSGI